LAGKIAPMSASAIEGRIREFLLKDLIWDVPREQLTSDYSLVGSNAIDSLAIIRLVTLIEEEFRLELGDEDLVPENFETIGNIARLIEKRQAS